MKPAPFAYHDPASLNDVVGLLSSLEDVKLLAGGQSLMPMLNMRFVITENVIDLNGVDGMEGVSVDQGTVTIGAMTRQAELMTDKAIRENLPVMAEALEFVGHFQTRNRGTIGGSLCHLDPAAELPLVTLLHDAELQVRGPEGTRKVAAKDWPLAYMMPSLAPEEILVSMKFAPWTGTHGYAFEEYARRHGDFAIVAIACLLAVENGVIAKAALAIGGVQQVPFRAEAAEAALVGQPANTEIFALAAQTAAGHEAMSDAYVTSRYRQRLVAVLTERAFKRAAGRAGVGNAT